MPGAVHLFVVTGYPYSGQNEVIQGVKDRLAGSDVQFVEYIRSLPPPVEGEEEEGEEEKEKVDGRITQEEFDLLVEENGVLGSWSEEGVSVGIPAAAIVPPEDGKVIRVVTVAATSLADVKENIGEKTRGGKGDVQVTVFSISDSNPDMYLARARALNPDVGEADIQQVIQMCDEVLKADGVVSVDNSTPNLKDGVTNALKAFIKADPDCIVPMNDGLDLQLCTAKEFLNAAVYPLLKNVMERVNRERPSDPIEAIGLYLYEAATIEEKRVKELEELKRVQEELREKLDADFNAGSRV